VSSSAGGARPVSRRAAVTLVAALAACVGGGDDSGGGSATTAAGPGPSGEFSVLTYDVAGLPEEMTRTVRPGEHIPLISPMLNDYDIVLTQNDYDWFVPAIQDSDVVTYHDRLRAEVSHQFRSTPYPGPVTAGISPDSRPELQLGDGLGVLSRYPFVSRHPLDDVTRVGWRGCYQGLDAEDEGAGDCIVARGFAVVTLSLDNGVEVDVYTMQAEVGEHDEDQRLQADNFDQLAAYIEQHSGENPVLVAGATSLDTRADAPDTAIWTGFLQRTGLTDACQALSCDQPDAVDRVAFRSGDTVELTASALDVPRTVFVDAAGDDLSYRPPLNVRFRWEVSPAG
jgi:hypothetical protein